MEWWSIGVMIKTGVRRNGTNALNELKCLECLKLKMKNPKSEI
jgi:hypothetical protein